MQKIVFYALLLAFESLVATAAFAQNTNYYSYYNDHKFWDTDDVIGYTFVPNEREIPGGKTTKLRTGEAVFKVMRDYLYVTEGGTETKYSVNQITSESFGLKMQLMDARNPTIQGHLKIVRDENRFVRAVIFKKSGQEKEVIYHQAEPTLAQERKNSQYFTHKDSTLLRDRDAFWGKKLHPFFQLSGTQTRIYAEDSLTITFTQDTVITKKAKVPTAKDSLLIAQGKKKIEKDKVKIIEQIHLRYLEEDEKDPAAPRKIVVLDFPITSIKRIENKMDGEQAKDLRYKYELKVEGIKGSDPFLVFVTDRQTISVVVMGDISYLMQGM